MQNFTEKECLANYFTHVTTNISPTHLEEMMVVNLQHFAAYTSACLEPNQLRVSNLMRASLSLRV